MKMGCMKQQPPVLLNYVEKANNLRIILDLVDPTYIVERLKDGGVWVVDLL
jgi:hypothetical protein